MGLCLLFMEACEKIYPGLTMIYLTSVVALAVVYRPFRGSDPAGIVRPPFGGLAGEKFVNLPAVKLGALQTIWGAELV
jgi:hypothetical protein